MFRFALIAIAGCFIVSSGSSFVAAGPDAPAESTAQKTPEPHLIASVLWRASRGADREKFHGRSSVDIAVWDSGLVIWHSSPVEGGYSYAMLKADEIKKVTELIGRLELQSDKPMDFVPFDAANGEIRFGSRDQNMEYHWDEQLWSIATQNAGDWQAKWLNDWLVARSLLLSLRPRCGADLVEKSEVQQLFEKTFPSFWGSR